MKKTQLIAVLVLVLVAIIVAGQAFAGWGGARRARRGQNMEQGGPAYLERQGPMQRGGPRRGAPGPDWERGTAGPGWEGGGPGMGRRPYAETPRRRGRGRAEAVCPCCGAPLGGEPGARNGFGPWRGQRLGVGRGYGPDQNFQRGQRGPGWRNPRRGDIAVRRRFMRDRWQRGPAQPYRYEQGFRRGDGQGPGSNRMGNWGPPQRRGMGGPGPHGLRPENGDQSVRPGPPRGRRGAWPQGTPGGQPEPQAGPQSDVPAGPDGAEPEAGE